MAMVVHDSPRPFAIPELTPRQREIFLAIYEGARRNGYQPSYDDLCAMFHIKTRGGIGCHIQAIHRKGLAKMSLGSRDLRFLVRPDGTRFEGFFDDPPLAPRVVDSVPLADMPTEGQRDLIMHLYSRVRMLGFQPSVCEMMIHFNFVSPNAVHQKIRALDRKGWIATTGHARGVRIIRRPDGTPFSGFSDRAAEGGVR